MNDHMHTIVGVLPPLPNVPERERHVDAGGRVPVPLQPGDDEPAVAGASPRRIAVLKPGATMEQMEHSLSLVSQRLHASYPDAYPAARKLTHRQSRRYARRSRATRAACSSRCWRRRCSCSIIAGANFTNLTLARQLRRGREMALRSALGADRKRLFRQLVTESLCVTMAGGALGVVVASADLGCSARSPRASRRAPTRSGSMGRCSPCRCYSAW